MTKPKDRTVYRRDDSHWANKRNDADRASNVHQSQREAINAARESLHNQGGGEMTIKGRDGQIRGKDTVSSGSNSRSSKEHARTLIDTLSRHAGEDLQVHIPGEKDVTLPATSVRLLVNILAQMAAGNTVTLVADDKHVTTQQAAQFLGVSRPFVTKLLKEGAIRYTTVGTHRRIRFKDLVSYKQTMESESYKAMAELTKQAQELGMGY